MQSCTKPGFCISKDIEWTLQMSCRVLSRLHISQTIILPACVMPDYSSRALRWYSGKEKVLRNSVLCLQHLRLHYTEHIKKHLSSVFRFTEKQNLKYIFIQYLKFPRKPCSLESLITWLLYRINKTLVKQEELTVKLSFAFLTNLELGSFVKSSVLKLISHLHKTSRKSSMVAAFPLLALL